jgi:hypothetical protein
MLTMRKAIVAAAAVIACLTLTASAAGEDRSAVVTTTPFTDQVLFNQCTGELLLVSGTLHTMARVVDDRSGQHIVADFSYSEFKAVAPETGAEYVLARGSRNAHYSDSTSFDFLPSVLMIEQNLIIVRLGEDASYPEGDDFHLMATTTLIIDANGVTRVDQTVFRIECL